MQIDVVRYKQLLAQEKKRHFDRGLYLYCRESGHKVDNCPKKQHRHTFKMKNATTSSNSEPKNGEAQHNRDHAVGLFTFHCFTIPFRLGSQRFKTLALLDSRAFICFLDE
jgi:hypothetical protein